MNNFIFSYPTKVYFGKGCAKEYLASLLRGYGPTVMLAYGGGSLKKSGVYDQMLSILAEAGKTVVEFGGIMPNPTYAKVQEGAKLVKEHHVDFILAVGGGSVIDCSKIVSAQAMTDSDIWELENVKREYPTKFIPMGAVVTASGTGSEMNNGAVITHEEKKIKGGMMGAHNDFAMLDPMYTMTVPFRQVVSGVFDTLSHAMETYFGKPQENNLSDDISEAVMRSVIANIRVLLTDPENYNARSELMWASAMAENGILKIGKVTDFQCHQMEHQLGAYTDCNHGAGLAVLHPAYYRHIYKDGLAKFKRFAVRVWGIDPTGKTDEEVAAAGVEALADFIKEIGLPTTLRELGVDESIDLGIIAASCNVAPGSYGKMCHAEIAAIFSECR